MTSLAANHEPEGRCDLADLHSRTITPPMTMAIESLNWITTDGRKKAPSGQCLATDTRNPTPLSAPQTRPSVIVATISLLLAAVATTQPTSSDRRRLPIQIPL